MAKTKKELPNNEIGTSDLSKIITSIQEGNSEGFETLFNLYYRDVYNIAMKNVNDSDKASDITQETFIEIYETISALREPDAFKSWVKKIAYHRCTNYFRSKVHKHETLIGDDEEYESFINNMEEDNRDFLPEEALDQEALKEILLNIINDLPEEQREAMLMYYYEDMSAGEIAEIQGVSVDTVRSRLYYGRKAMKKAIEEYEKKNGTKLHAVAFPLIPLFRWVLNESKAVPSFEATASIAEGISAATGVTVTATSTATTTAAITAGAGTTAKAATLSLATKIVATIAATALIAVPTVMYVNKQRNTTELPSETVAIVETKSPTQSTEIVTTGTTFIETEPPIEFESVLSAYTDKELSTEYISGDWTNTDVYITISSNDDEAKLYYKTSDAEEFIEFDGNLTFIEDGMYSCEFKTVYSDETETTSSLNVNIDKTLPTVNCEIVDKYSPDSLASEVVAVYEMLDSSWSGYGENKIKGVQSLDELLEFESKYEHVQYAVTGLSSRNEAILAAISKEWISNANAYITVNCSEELSGINSIRYFLGELEYTEVNPQFNIYGLSNGEYDLRVIITDNAGNIGKMTLPIKKNDTPPETIVNCEVPSGSYITEEQILSVTSNYGDCWYTLGIGSGGNSYTSSDGWVFDGATYTEKPPCEPGTTYTCSSSQELDFTAYSLSGLKGNTVEYVLHMDKEKPYINITSESTTAITGNLGDEDTPVVEAYYSVDGTKTVVTVNEHNRGNFSISLPDAAKEIKVYVRDSVGNEFVWNKTY